MKKSKDIKINLVEQPVQDAKTAILILPGGAYFFVSPTESECVADKFNSLGYSAFVLKYSVFPHRYPTALLETATAIKYIKDTYPALKNVVVCGFSAGGHLAGNISTQYNSPLVLSATNGANVRPDAAILCYPLITFDKEFRHKGSFYCLCGNFNKKLKRSLSIEKIVTKDTPPMFIWHTKEDTCVPCQNSIMMAKALENNGIAHKLMLFPHGPHGLSLASPEAPVDKSFYFDDVAQWPNLAKEWLDTILK